MSAPVRLPDAASLKTVAGLDPASADADLIPALSAAFKGFDFRRRLLARHPLGHATGRDASWRAAAADGVRTRQGWRGHQGALDAPERHRPADHGMARHKRLRLRADRDAAVLLRWADRTYGF
jgi:hypothetical protein